MLRGDGNKNCKKKKKKKISWSNQQKKNNFASAAHLFCTFLAVIFYDYNVKLPETSQLHVLWRNIVCVPPVHFFQATHQFTLVAPGSNSHFLTTAIKFSCYSSKVIGLLCLLSLALALSVVNEDIKQLQHRRRQRQRKRHF